ncbi:MAG TPA: hypothetical protein VEZ70_11650 [Allosphingosinicella sp.]|nr:hypothetical protein [Allosphingosinicella sp.]
MKLASRLGATLLLLGLGACAPKQVAPTAGAPPPERPQSYSVVGLESVIGRTARVLETQFGRPALDIREGPARKLQFASAVCVLDAYLYPPAGGGEAIVTHLDARLPDGRDIDRASCAQALVQARR